MGRNPFTQNGLLRTLSMSTCVKYAKKSLTNPSKQNAKPPIYLCQLPFICLLRHVDRSAQFAELQLKILRSSLNQLLLFYELYYQN